jgi:hypothetical protein
MSIYINRDLPNDEYNAAVGANNPSSANVFATMADIVAGTGDAERLIFNVRIDQVGGINKGQAVYVSGANGTNILVTKADYTTEATSSKTLGLLVATGANNALGQVVANGILKGTGSAPLDTSAAVAGDPVWLGDDGNLIYGLINKPYAPNHLVFIGIVVEANPTVGEIFVKVQNGFELKEIHDVDLISNPPTDGEVLTYDSSSGLWINEALPATIGENLNINLSPVIDNTITDPSTLAPDYEDAYLVPIGAIGVWAGQDNNIATWDGEQWLFYTPSASDSTTVLTGPNAGYVYTFDGAVWNITITTSPGATPFYIAGSGVDAGGNKTSQIARVSGLTLGSNSGSYGSSPLTVRGTGSLENVVSRWGMGAGTATTLGNWFRIAGFTLSNNTSKNYQILINIGGRTPNTWASAILHINLSKVSGTGQGVCIVVNNSGPGFNTSIDNNFRLDESNFEFRRYANAAGGTVNFRLYYKPTVLNSSMSATVLNSAGGTTSAIGIQWFNTYLGAVIEGPASGGNTANIATFNYSGQRTNISAIVDPTVNDDTNLQYTIGSLWYNTVTQNVFQCLDNTLNAAVWKQITNDTAVTLYNQQIQNEGSNLTQRNIINFVGAGVDATDNGTNTVVTVPGVTTQSFFDQFMVNQYSYFLPSDNSALFDTLRAGGTLTSVGTTSSLTENPMGVLFTTPTAISSVAALFGNTFGGSILGVNFQFETHRRFRINTANPAQRLFIGLSSLYSAATPTNIDPISQINSIGVCKTSTNNNLFLMWNDATGTASSLDTGFTGISNAFTYTLRIFKTFGIASVTIELTQITNSTGATSVFSTTITSDYNTGVNHFPVAWMGNSTTSTGAVSYKDYGCTMTKRNIITA